MTTIDRTVTTVVFDLGNVLLRWDPAAVFEGRLTDTEVAEFMAAVDFPTLNHSLDAGRTWAQARPEVAERAPGHVHHMDAYVRDFARSLVGEVPGTAQVARDLLAAGIRVLGLTNWSAETFEHAPRAAPVLAEFEQILVSGTVGLAKPDPAIFHLLIRTTGIVPVQTVFIDDSPANVAAATELGFQALLFTDAPTFRDDLVARGLAIPRS
ncbi:HAD family phosphatase [Occultella glacieicola]|uniref:HAD family phosphatase n=1 Tax=Occultella glacieicola TaxID=2518684 RepID=A0ABY2E1P0_9MICO|nr:HAD family phosphatase [Occultella glacieicola]TDE92504.1 HAD family phosphatase [Occultella glacieicola]